MKQSEYRTEKDSMGELKVPKDALWGAQTQRAIENFDFSDLTLPYPFIQALCLIKQAAAKANEQLGLLDPKMAEAIIKASEKAKLHPDHFPLDIFQTGSGTSSNMNANEVISTLANAHSETLIHPNDHVNMSQSSNDVIPTAIHLSASLEIHKMLLPAWQHLSTVLGKRAHSFAKLTKTGRTHLMDAMPITLGQELSGWKAQVDNGIERLQSTLPRLQTLALGGTAVGTGINAHPDFGQTVTQVLSEYTEIPFTSSRNYFESLSCMDTAVECSGQLKVMAISLFKIANDLRWMNSGPLAGLGEISLPPLQPGSSIMPGKVNPVIPEAVCMIAAQVVGNDATITMAGSSGTFQLNVMMPVIAYNLLQSIILLTNAARCLADKAIAGFTVNEGHIQEQLSKNPILITALNPIIGYAKGAEIVKQSYQQKRPLKEIALKMTDLSSEELDKLLDPYELTKGGIR